jgi:hypothetical protein
VSEQPGIVEFVRAMAAFREAWNVDALTAHYPTPSPNGEYRCVKLTLWRGGAASLVDQDEHVQMLDLGEMLR